MLFGKQKVLIESTSPLFTFSVTLEVLVSRCEYLVFVYMPDKVCIRLIAFRLCVALGPSF